jgi:type IV pilus assembly protein PilW
MAHSHQQNGFSLVEIMVGLTIGMLATIVIMQVFSQFEAQKRISTGTADAQTNGSIGLFTITRDLQQAGYPLMSVTNSPLECTTVTDEGVAVGTDKLSPITVIEGGMASDSITIRYGNSAMGGVPSVITAVASPTPNDVTISNHFGCLANDKVLITSVNNCAFTSATAISPIATPPATITLANTTSAIAGATLACLGTWNEITYTVNNGNLEKNGVAGVTGIVNLQAQYGISSVANSNQITQWVDATGGVWGTPSVADRNRIKAIRIAVIARNSKIETSNISSACSSITTASPTGICAWEGNLTSPAPSVDLSNVPDWDKYRYRVFETIVPLRNVIWSKNTL